MYKYLIAFVAIIIPFVAAYSDKNNSPETSSYVAHEWGTFTSVSRSDGRLLDGLYIEEEKLPSFVESFVGLDNKSFGLKGPMRHNLAEIKGVNIKMETPVIYFYSNTEQKVKVNVKFNGGVISEWYPAAGDDKRSPTQRGTSSPETWRGWSQSGSRRRI